MTGYLKTGRFIAKTVSVLLVVSLAGCARFNSIQRNVDLTTTSITIDAEQRVVISAPDPTRTIGNHYARIVCAEPSPDVLKVRGSNFSALLDKAGKQDIELALSAAEAGQNIGLRTQSIQLLRDAMYRTCEGAAAGMIEKKEFEEIQERFQKLTAVLLATEQLTGAVQPRLAPVLAVGGSSSTGQGIQAAQTELDNAKAAQADQQKKATDQQQVVATKQTAYDGVKDGTDEAAKIKAKNELDSAQNDLKSLTDRLGELQDNTAAAQQKRDAARGLTVNTQGTAILVQNTDPPRTIDKDTAQVIATAVSDMVTKVFDQDSASQRCLRYYIESGRERVEKETLLKDTAQDLKLPEAATNDLLALRSVSPADFSQKAQSALNAARVDDAARKQLDDAINQLKVTRERVDTLQTLCDKMIDLEMKQAST